MTTETAFCCSDLRKLVEGELLECRECSHDAKVNGDALNRIAKCEECGHVNRVADLFWAGPGCAFECPNGARAVAEKARLAELDARRRAYKRYEERKAAEKLRRALVA